MLFWSSSRYLIAFRELNNTHSCMRWKVNSIFPIKVNGSSVHPSGNKQQYLHPCLHMSLKCVHFLSMQVLINCYPVLEWYLKHRLTFSSKYLPMQLCCFHQNLKHLKICWYKSTPPPVFQHKCFKKNTISRKQISTSIMKLHLSILKLCS